MSINNTAKRLQWLEDCKNNENPATLWEIMHRNESGEYIPATFEQCDMLIGERLWEGALRRKEESR